MGRAVLAGSEQSRAEELFAEARAAYNWVQENKLAIPDGVYGVLAQLTRWELRDCKEKLEQLR